MIKTILVAFVTAAILTFGVVKFAEWHAARQARSAWKICSAAGGDHLVHVRGAYLCISKDGRLLN